MDIHTINTIGQIVFNIMQETMKRMDERSALAPYQVFSHEEVRDLVAAPMFVSLQAIESLLQTAMNQLDDYHDKLEAESLERIQIVQDLTKK